MSPERTRERTPRATARQTLARALGVADDPAGVGSRCALCGPSPFPRSGPVARGFGVGFSDWDACEDPAAPDLCAGCARLLAGRPGDEPPPLRTRTVAVVDGAIVLPDAATVWGWLLEPPPALTVLSWAVSRQRPHWLYAEACTPERLGVGSDGGTIGVEPAHDGALGAAVAALRACEPGDPKQRAWCTRDEILSGRYRAATLAGRAARWRALEAIVAPRRGDPALALFLAHCPVGPVSTSIPPITEVPVLDPLDLEAAQLLAALAQDSHYRQTEGLQFWGGVFARRVQRHAGRPLAAAVSRLLEDLRVPPASPGAQAAIERLRALDTPAQQAVAQRLRERTTLLVALAFDAVRAARDARTASSSSSPSSPSSSVTTPRSV